MRSHAVLRPALTQGVKWGWLTVNPAANASPPRSKKHHLELPDPADVARLIEVVARVNPSLPTYFHRLRDELGLEGVKLHHLRHFSATQLLSAGIDIRTVSGRLGHANASTTLNFYAQFLQAADERAADALGSLLRTPTSTTPSIGADEP